ncbi:MAG: hypothetical protein KDC14_05530 [Planctomycetes bacterium]|nr:hypothetical protein [Planctomycetota bacterium]
MRLTRLTSTLGGLAVALLAVTTASAQCPAPDAFEDSDDCANAAALTAGTYTNLTCNGIFAAGGEDKDFYSISVNNGEILQMDCTHLVANGDIDVWLYDAASPTCGDQLSYLTRGWTSTDNENFTWANNTGAAVTYIVEVEAWDNDTDFDCNDYTLTLTTFPDPCSLAVDDSFEPNDSCGAAVALAAGTHTGLFASTGSEDYYTINVPAAEILTVDVTYASGVNADIDLELFDDLACTNQVDFSFSFGGTGQVEWANATGAAATIVMRAAPDALTGTCNNYDLNVVTAPDPCLDPLADDSFEDNDDCANAVSMGDGTYPGLFVSKADHDYYEVTVADGDTLFVDLAFTHATADVDVYIYDDLVACGDLTSYLVRGFSASDNENISWTNTTGASQTYYVQVVVYVNSGGECNNYDMTLTGTGGSFATPMCLGDGSGTPCPCANESTLGAGEGCKSSLGFGAILTASGSASVGADDIAFTLTQGRANQPSMLVQGSTLIAVPFKDGVLCMGNPTERVEVVFLDANGEGTTVGSVVTNGNVLPGSTLYYQQWYRDPGGVSPCGTGSNFSNGLTVVYLP